MIAGKINDFNLFGTYALQFVVAQFIARPDGR